jgi:hypothetical protein
MRKCLGFVTLAAIVLVLSSAPASAAFIVSVSGDASLIAAPADADQGANVNDYYTVWEEGSGDIVSDLSVDHDGTAGSFLGNGGAFSPTTLTAGTKYNSAIVHLETLTDGLGLKAVIEFTTEIIGMSLFSPSIDDGDPDYGAPGTDYPTNEIPIAGLDTRGIDFRANDKFTISADGKTLSVHFTANGLGFDQIRVFTSGVPEPASLAVWSILASVMGGGTWWRKRKNAV